jgi:hypothetical protein
MAMYSQQPILGDLWTQHQRRNPKKTRPWACMHCRDRKLLYSTDELWNNALLKHRDRIPKDDKEEEIFQREYLENSSEKQ